MNNQLSVECNQIELAKGTVTSLGIDFLHLRNENTGITPEGEMYMTSSSFHTENC